MGGLEAVTRPIVRIGRQERCHDLLEELGDIGDAARQRRRRPVRQGTSGLERSRAERKVSARCLVEYNAERKQIAPTIEDAELSVLRSYVTWRAERDRRRRNGWLTND